MSFKSMFKYIEFELTSLNMLDDIINTFSSNTEECKTKTGNFKPV